MLDGSARVKRLICFHAGDFRQFMEKQFAKQLSKQCVAGNFYVCDAPCGIFGGWASRNAMDVV